MGGWAILAIVIGFAVVSAISHVLKNQQQNAPPRRRELKRERRENVRVASDAEQDRFLAEIERLRKKAPPTAKPVPTVKPAKTKSPRASQAESKFDKLPVATIVSPQGTRASETRAITITPPSNVAAIAGIATIAGIMDVTKPADAGDASAAKMLGTGTAGRSRSTGFAKDLLGLLKQKNSMATAVVLQEILGPPKSQRG